MMFNVSSAWKKWREQHGEQSSATHDGPRAERRIFILAQRQRDRRTIAPDHHPAVSGMCGRGKSFPLSVSHHGRPFPRFHCQPGQKHATCVLPEFVRAGTELPFTRRAALRSDRRMTGGLRLRRRTDHFANCRFSACNSFSRAWSALGYSILKSRKASQTT